MRYKGVTKFMAGLLAAAMVVTGIPVATLDTAEAKSKTEKLSYKGYTKVWEDNFDGNSLNMKDWNVETHEPGWVNAELQEYTESGNIKVSDGKLTIIPKRTKNADGTYSYTSGRINTQNKHDFKYGIMEARMKFPKGQGYLPAFWMMPTNENLYGQWPKCGEIDIAEVMGQDTKKIYGTIHYGEPHAQSQGTEVLKKGNFADDWHTCAVEWEPGSIKWYVDGVLYHEENQWFTKTPGQGEVTYPAPFDQNFYIIFNLAIGGSWVGYPDKTTDYNSNFQVDYVKVYQKKNYSENVKKPEKKVVLKKADKKGNFISNADFSKNEKLDGSANWQFMTAQSGEGSAAIKNKKIEIKTKNAGKEEYSIQLVQPGLPMEKGATYEVSFDAYADKARTMKVDISGPDMNYMRYFNDTAVNLTTKKKSYKFKFTMNEDTDANSRLEFNMGAQGSTANVYITNVKVKKVKSATKAEANKKTVLADGNLVYNGKFQEGDKRLGYWNVKKKNATVAVSNKDYNDRKLVVKLTKNSKASDVKVYQTGLAFEANKEYSVSFDANASDARSIKVRVAGKTFTAKLNKATKNYEFIMKTGKKLSDKSVIFSLGGKKGTVCIDNVVVTENSLIKNGSFNAGTTGWTEWHDTSEADLSFVIDSLSEDNAADFTIKKTGSEDWKIQLKQENVPLEKDQYYKLTFKAKSSKTREMRAIMQGLEDKGWAVYSGENTVKLTSKYKTYTKVFQMTADSDPKSQISFCLGAVGGKSINTQHRVCIDDVNLEIISEEEAKKYIKKDDSAASEEVAGSLIANGSFNDGSTGWTEWHDTNAADASFTVTDKAADMTINKTGTEDWHVQLKQDGITLTKGKLYRLKFNAKSTKERKIRAIMQGGESKNYEVYSGENIVTVTDKYKTYSKVFEMTSPTDTQVSFGINFGKVDGKVIDETHHVYIDDVSLVELTDEEAKAYKEKHATNETSWTPPTTSIGTGTTPEKKLTIMNKTAVDAGIAKVAGATVTTGKDASGNLKIAIPTNGGAGSEDKIQIPVADASTIAPGKTSEVKVNISCTSDNTVRSFRSRRLFAESNEDPSVKVAIKDANKKLHILKKQDGNGDTLDFGKECVFLCPALTAEELVGAQIVILAGLVNDKSLVINKVASQEIENALETISVSNVNKGDASNVLSAITGGFQIKINNSGTAAHTIQYAKPIADLKNGATYEYSYDVRILEPVPKKYIIRSEAQPNDAAVGYWDENTTKSLNNNIEVTQAGTHIRKQFTAVADEVNSGKREFRIDLGYENSDGTKNGVEITAPEDAVTLVITNINFIKISDKAYEASKPIPAADPGEIKSPEVEKPETVIDLLAGAVVDENIFKNSATGLAEDKGNGEVEIQITDSGAGKEDIQIDSKEITLEVGATYRWSFDIKTTNTWGVSASMQKLEHPSYPVYASKWDQRIEPGDFAHIESDEFTCDYSGAKFFMQMGMFDFNDGNTTTLNIKNLKLIQTKPAPAGGNTETNLFRDPTLSGESWWNDWDVSENGGSIKEGSKNNVNNALNFTITNIGTGNDSLFVKQGEINLDAGSYDISFDIQCNQARKIQAAFVDPGNSYQWLSGCTGEEGLEANTKKTIKMTLTLEESKTNLEFRIFLGKFNDTGIDSNVEHTVSVSNMKMIKK